MEREREGRSGKLAKEGKEREDGRSGQVDKK